MKRPILIFFYLALLCQITFIARELYAEKQPNPIATIISSLYRFPEAKMEELHLEALRVQMKNYHGWSRPEVTVESGYKQSEKSGTIYNFEIAQTIPFPGKKRSKKFELKKNLDLQSLRLEKRRIEILSEAIKSVYELHFLRAQEQF